MEKGRGLGGCGGETRGIKEHIQDLDVNGSIILKWLLKKWERSVDWVDMV